MYWLWCIFLLGTILEKVKSERVNYSFVSNYLHPLGYVVHGILQTRILEWVAFPLSMGIPNPGIEPRSPALLADSLPAETQGKPKNTGVGSVSLLQQFFPTQESNWSLLHCRWILYQLSYQGSPHSFHTRQIKISLYKQKQLGLFSINNLHHLNMSKNKKERKKTKDRKSKEIVFPLKLLLK